MSRNNTNTAEAEPVTETITPLPATTPVVTDAERVYNLYVELQRTKIQKKDAAAGFRDEIKRIENEIKDILKSANEDIGEGSNE